jgi:hypothetical protein
MNSIGHADVTFHDGNMVRIEIWDNGLTDMQSHQVDSKDIQSIRSTFYPESADQSVGSGSEHLSDGEWRGPHRVRLSPL